ncbi:MAG: FHA domain-containing protein [Oscillospiraceae bacterium]|nr:FHA domain-containing protein [Oscillospiraceae bacterium]
MDITVYAAFFLRVAVSSFFIIVLGICLGLLFKKKQGASVIAQLINTANGDKMDVNLWEVSIGRAKSCDLVLGYSAVSRFHAVLARRGRGLTVFDTHSRTGVLVNGEKIDKKAKVFDGDMITMGNSVLLLRAPLFKKPRKTHEPYDAELKEITFDDIFKDEPLRGEYGGGLPVKKNAPPPIPSGNALAALVNLSYDGLNLLFSEEYTIGRGGECDIVIPSINVSRKHSRLIWTEDGWLIEDMNSKSGTLVNGRYISVPQLLFDGDIVTMGNIDLEFNADYVN